MSSDVADSETTDASTELSNSMTSALRGLASSANVDRVFGDPIERGDRTVVPVARVRYGFGGGFGSANEHDDDDPAEGDDPVGEGAGAGGGVDARPVGALEITDDDTRFVPFTNRRRFGLVALAGVALGYLLGRRGRDSK